MGLSQRVPEGIENDKDDPLGKLVEFSNRFGATVSDSRPDPVDANPMSALFDAANHFMPYSNYPYPQTTNWTSTTMAQNANNGNSPTMWWSALAGAAGCDPTSAWLTNYGSPTTATSGTEAATVAAVSAYGSTYLGSSFPTLPAAGLLPTISPLGSNSAGSGPASSPDSMLRNRSKNPRGGGKASSKTSCECPNCAETARIGLANMPKNRQGIHDCHIPGCQKIYKKASHLKAHLRWHSTERPVKKYMMNQQTKKSA
uniref:C2H2-type domain-containing protein n=1 Tax=Panagrolaimus sp. JU765 TaxID=591449 RepID=A0AC34QVR9_9BILA